MKRLGLAGIFLCLLVLVGKLLAHPTLNNFLTVAPPITSNATLNDLHSGMVFTNLGATGAVIVNLPRAIPGLHITFSLAAYEDVDINPDNNDQILGITDSAGDAISSDKVAGSAIQLVAIDADYWVPIAKVGTWSNAN